MHCIAHGHKLANVLQLSYLCLFWVQSSFFKSLLITFSVPYRLKVRIYCGRQEEPAILIFRLLLRMRRMYVVWVWTSFKKEWNAQNTIWSRAFGPSITRNMITRFLTHMKLSTQSTVILTFDRCSPQSATFTTICVCLMGP